VVRMVVLKLEKITKAFGSVKAVNGLSLEIQEGEFFTLLGPSGCGKTTTLRLVAGLEEPDNGEILYQDRAIVSVQRRLFVPPHKRNLGMVFQSYAIWPNMTVYENVAYPLRLRRVPQRVAREKVLRVIELVGLSGMEERPGPLLSGGQQQRVALARALVYEPALLLLDEPFSNLDAKLREQMRFEVKLLQKKLGITVLFVTHDQIEALSLSDRLAVLNKGGVEQVGSPHQLYQQPDSPFVRDFLGKTVILRGKAGQSKGENAIEVRINGMAQPLFCNHGLHPISPGQEVYVAIRPEDVVLHPHSGEGVHENLLQATVEALLFVGDRCEVRLQLGGSETVICYISGREKLEEGQVMRLSFPREVMSVWPV